MQDYTNNGICSECGRCCTSFLPLSGKEISKIKKFIKSYKIEPVYKHNLMTGEYVNRCPFLDDNNLCNIYEVRPSVCKRYNCATHGKNGFFDFSDKRIINMFAEFFPKLILPTPPDIGRFNMAFEEAKKNQVRNLIEK